jgi:RNA polymerase sigma-70 factor, ECF subfamily
MQLPMPIGLANLAIPHDERELVERAKRDREAFALLYRRHYAMVAGYLYRRTGDTHVTEDLAAEVFLAALRCLPRYRHRGLPIQAWLYRIACNTANRWSRRQRARIAARLHELSCEPATNAPAVNDDGERARLAMLSIKTKYQAVLTLHYLEGMSIEEVATAIGCRVGTVKSRLSRGRDALRERLTRG